MGHVSFLYVYQRVHRENHDINIMGQPMDLLRKMVKYPMFVGFETMGVSYCFLWLYMVK